MSRAPWRVMAADDFQTSIIERGDLALEAFGHAPFDIVLLDVEMPGLDGFEVGTAIRRSHGAGFPVVLVSGRCDPEFVERAQALSAALIAKPVNWSSLAGQLRALLKTP